MVDRERGKALVDLTVKRGTAVPDRHLRGDREPSDFSNEDIARFYPFGDRADDDHRRGEGALAPGAGRTTTSTSIRRAGTKPTRSVGEAYANEGYIYASMRPVVERRDGAGLARRP